jgi:hypothetical protein
MKLHARVEAAVAGSLPIISCPVLVAKEARELNRHTPKVCYIHSSCNQGLQSPPPATLHTPKIKAYHVMVATN